MEGLNLRLEQGGQKGECLKIGFEKQAGTTPHRVLCSRERFNLYPKTSSKSVKTFTISSCNNLVYMPCCCNNKTLIYCFN